MSAQFEWKYGGNSVHLAGSFNNWNRGHMRQENGLWITNLDLVPGTYHYKFIVDGVWMYDMDKDWTDDGCGNINNLLFLEEKEEERTEREDTLSELQKYGPASPRLKNRLRFQPTFFPTEVRPHPKKLKRQKKFSSTATLFLSSALFAPDVKEIVICLSRALYYTMKNQEKKEPKIFNDIFSEEKYPLLDGKTDLFRTPDQSEIQEFLVLLFSSQELSAECGVMTAVYVDRLIQLTDLTLHASNWRRIVLGALLLASKIWEDVGIWNVDYLYSLPNLQLTDLGLLERQYLLCLKFTVFMNQSAYAKYYFELRALSDLTEGNFPLRPLDHQGAEELDARSRGMEANIRNKNKTNSLDHYNRDSPVTLLQLQKKFGKW